MTRQHLLVYLILAVPAPAQRLYNADQDKRAQDALKTGKDLSPAGGFDAALENLNKIWKLRQEQVFRSAHTQMRADMGSGITWGQLRSSVAAIVETLKPQLDPGDPVQLKKQLDTAKTIRDSAKAELAELAKTASANPAAGIASVGTWLERINQVEPVATYVIGMEKDTSASKAQVAAAGKASTALQNLATLYKDFKLDLPTSPSPLLMEYQLQLLSLQVQHITEEVKIQERLDQELNITLDVLAPVQTALSTLNLPDNERIADRLDRVATAAAKAVADGDQAAATANRRELTILTGLLYNASALVARGNTPVRLANLRVSMEERASALRLSGGTVAFHQQLIVNGLQRLALYYQGGVKASSIADLIQALATVGIAPAVWTK